MLTADIINALSGPPPGAPTDWRRSEAAMFRVMAALEDGDTPPDVRELPPEVLRRLGYAAELVGRFRSRDRRDTLLAFAGDAYNHACKQTRERFTTLTAVPGGTAVSTPNLDALAEKWGFNPGLDLHRYEMERRPRYHTSSLIR